jgi:hypothetical protein
MRNLGMELRPFRESETAQNKTNQGVGDRSNEGYFCAANTPNFNRLGHLFLEETWSHL